VSIAVIMLVAVFVSACGGAPAPSAWSGIIVSGKIAYLTATDRVYALDTNVETPNLSREKWAFPPADQNAAVTFHGPLALFDGVLYTGSDAPSGAGVLFAFDAATGEGKWSYPAGEPGASLASVYGGVASDGKWLVAGTNDGRVVGVDAQTGQLKWTFPPTTTAPIGRIWSTPAISGSFVYAATQDHKLYALKMATGEPAWPSPFQAGALLAGTPTVYGDTVYVGSFDQKLYAINAADGTPKWAKPFEAQGWLWDGPAVFDNLLYFGDLSGNLYAVKMDGTAAWDQPVKLEGAIRAQPLVTADRIYVVTNARRAYALDRANQKPVWIFTTLQDGEALLTTPVLVGNSLLIAPLPSGGTPVRLYSVNAASGNLQWQFPVPQPKQ
jgi:serine/threonine-protein kinase